MPKGVKSSEARGPDLTEALGRRAPRLRQRVAWMYYVEEMTQSAIADALGIGRITVVRLLAEARGLNEVRMALSRDIVGLSRLEFDVQKKFGLPEVVAAPISSERSDPANAVAAAAGDAISQMLRPGMKIGLGWGNTLNRTLGFIQERQVPNLSVVSLLGGITRARHYNPAEFAWQFSRVFMADCYLLAAPAVVDSAETKRTLIERCGLKEVYDLSKSLDAVVVGVGTTTPQSTTNYYGVLSNTELRELRACGAVGDLLYNFFDEDGRIVDHSINKRVMSIPLSTLAAAPVRVLVAGGREKIKSLIGAFKLLRPTLVITDEATAGLLLDDGVVGKKAK